MRSRASSLGVLALSSLALSFGLPDAASGAAAGPYHVKVGSTVFACGGIAPFCRVHDLSGNLTLAVEGDQPGDGARFAAANLKLINAFGSLPFPHVGDLSLQELEGEVGHAGELVFVSPPGSFQTVNLRLVPFGNGPGVTDGYVMFGTYDEGCCDRAVFDLGNVVLLPNMGKQPATLADGRFEISATWTRPDTGAVLEAAWRPDGPLSTTFYFFVADNPEVFVKLVDACALEHPGYWFFAAGLTNVEVELTVLDTATGAMKVVRSTQGELFPAVVDTTTFSCLP
jgi:hypothetical protein